MEFSVSLIHFISCRFEFRQNCFPVVVAIHGTTSWPKAPHLWRFNTHSHHHQTLLRSTAVGANVWSFLLGQAQKSWGLPLDCRAFTTAF